MDRGVGQAVESICHRKMCAYHPRWCYSNGVGRTRQAWLLTQLKMSNNQSQMVMNNEYLWT